MSRFLAITFFLVAGLGCTHNPRNKNYLELAQKYHQKGAWQESLILSKKALKADTKNEEIYLLMAQNFSKLGKFTDAHQVIHERLALRPHSTKLNLALVQWHREFGSKEAAYELAKRMLARDPAQLSALQHLAQLALQKQNWRDAEISLSKIYELDKFDEESALSLGQLYLKQTQTSKALEVFERLFAGKSRRIEAAKYLAWIHAENGGIAQANTYLQYLSVEQQNDQFVQKIITKNLLNTNQVDKITVISNYLRQYPDDWGQHQMYLALQAAGHKEKALDLLANVWNESPDKRWAAINYANHLYASGDHKIAQDILNKARVGSDPADEQLIGATLNKWNGSNSMIAATREIAATEMVHKVQKGETLGGIAHKYLRDAARWNEIYQINKSKLKSPSVLSEGIELLIPKEQN